MNLLKGKTWLMFFYSCHWLKYLAIPKYLLLSLSTFKLLSGQVWSPPVGPRKTCIVRFLSFALRSIMLHFTLHEEGLQGITSDCLLPAPGVKGQFLQWDGSQDLDVFMGLVAVKESGMYMGIHSSGNWGFVSLTSPLGYKTSKSCH